MSDDKLYIKNISVMRKKMLIFFIILLSAIGVIWFVSNRVITVSHYKIHGDVSIKVLLISDLHMNSFGKNNIRLIKAIRAEKPDLIAISGDILNSGSENTDGIFEFFSGLSEIAPTFYAIGNHEEQTFLSGIDESEFTDLVASTGVKLLNNEQHTMTTKDGKLVTITGLRTPLYYYSSYGNDGKLLYPLTCENMENLVGESGDGYNILIAHNPAHAEAYAKWGADLTLSGHNHGGVWRLPFLGGVFSPAREPRPRLDSGIYEFDGGYLAVTRGLGEHVAPLRLFNSPEVLVVEVEE